MNQEPPRQSKPGWFFLPKISPFSTTTFPLYINKPPALDFEATENFYIGILAKYHIGVLGDGKGRFAGEYFEQTAQCAKRTRRVPASSKSAEPHWVPS
jgi:hypothetical protein